MKLDFEHIDIYIDIERTKCVQKNLKKDFANLLYTMGNGIECHALALKIFNGNAETEYDKRECEIIKKFSEQYCAPTVIDAVNLLLTKKE
ncbi:MAG: hypothetical protein IKZ87_06115 [Actinomycetaceae bacterium]|nr:hypothetical protein [Actinomycetaceae bacterium]